MESELLRVLNYKPVFLQGMEYSMIPTAVDIPDSTCVLYQHAVHVFIFVVATLPPCTNLKKLKRE